MAGKPEPVAPEAGQRYRRLIEMTRGEAPLRTAIVHPVDPLSLGGAIETAREGLIVPVLVGRNMLVKQLEYLAGAQVAGVVLGARVPIMLTNRADNTRSRRGSAAIALLWVRRRPSRPSSER